MDKEWSEKWIEEKCNFERELARSDTAPEHPAPRLFEHMVVAFTDCVEDYTRKPVMRLCSKYEDMLDFLVTLGNADEWEVFSKCEGFESFVWFATMEELCRQLDEHAVFNENHRKSKTYVYIPHKPF